MKQFIVVASQILFVIHNFLNLLGTSNQQVSWKGVASFYITAESPTVQVFHLQEYWHFGQVSKYKFVLNVYYAFRVILMLDDWCRNNSFVLWKHVFRFYNKLIIKLLKLIRVIEFKLKQKISHEELWFN